MPLKEQKFMNVLIIEKTSIERILQKYPDYKKNKKENKFWLVDINTIQNFTKTIVNKWILLLSNGSSINFNSDIRNIFSVCLNEEFFARWYYDMFEIYCHMIFIRKEPSIGQKIIWNSFIKTEVKTINESLNKNLSIPQDVFDDPLVFFDFLKTIFHLQKDDSKKYWCISELVLLAIERTEHYLVNNVDSYHSWERYTYKDMCIWESHILNPEEKKSYLTLTVTDKSE